MPTTESFWIFWGVIAVVCFIAEVFTMGFFLMWFGVGAVAAAVIAYVGLSMPYQLGGFILVSALLVVFTRRLGEKMTGAEKQRAGAERLLGKQGVAVEPISPVKAGLVKFVDDTWRAVAEEEIQEGERVVVLGIDGTKVIVSRLKVKEQ